MYVVLYLVLFYSLFLLELTNPLIFFKELVLKKNFTLLAVVSKLQPMGQIWLPAALVNKIVFFK
jgi:hypothetical protein